MTVALLAEFLSPPIIISGMIAAPFVIMMALGKIDEAAKLYNLIFRPLGVRMEKISHLLSQPILNPGRASLSGAVFALYPSPMFQIYFMLIVSSAKPFK